ncbi:MAG: DUF429 domain-containing protein [Acidobacteriota bacterium]
MRGKRFYWKKVVIGIDLAGSQKQPTGLCIMKGFCILKTCLLFSDKEIIGNCIRNNPEIIAIDAPLSLPPGRKSIEDKTGNHLRVCDIELTKRRIKFFPITLGPMRMLTERGIRLKERLETLGLKVIEVYPGGALDIWKIPRKQKTIKKLKNIFVNLDSSRINSELTQHEFDAIVCAIVGMLFIHGKAEVYGNFEEGSIIMPSSSLRSLRIKMNI